MSLRFFLFFFFCKKKTEYEISVCLVFFFFQAEDGIRDFCLSRGLGDVYKRQVYDDEDEAIRRANDTEYGLAAGVVTQDLARAHRAIHRLEAGICWINTWGESPAEMPVGGYKQSGVGRENGLTTLAHYTRIKSVQVELGDYASVF